MDKPTQENINALILAARGGDDFAFNTLLERYTPMIGAAIKRLSLEDDGAEAFSEGCVGLYKAARTFNTEQNEVTFGLYARICVVRCLTDFIRSRNKRVVAIVDKDVERLAVPSGISAAMEAREEREEFLRDARALLSEYEYSVFNYWLLGYKTADIALALCKTAKSVDNTKARIIRKLRDGLGSHQA